MVYGDVNCPGQVTSLNSAVGLPEANTTNFAYDPVTCNLLTTTDPLNNVTSLAYDAAGGRVPTPNAKVPGWDVPVPPKYFTPPRP